MLSNLPADGPLNDGSIKNIDFAFFLNHRCVLMSSVYLLMKNSASHARKNGCLLVIAIFVFGMVLAAGCTSPQPAPTTNTAVAVTASPTALVVDDTSAPVTTAAVNITGIPAVNKTSVPAVNKTNASAVNMSSK